MCVGEPPGGTSGATVQARWRRQPQLIDPPLGPRGQVRYNKYVADEKNG
jgi:hypothetical protein